MIARFILVWSFVIFGALGYGALLFTICWSLVQGYEWLVG